MHINRAINLIYVFNLQNSTPGLVSYAITQYQFKILNHAASCWDTVRHLQMHIRWGLMVLFSWDFVLVVLMNLCNKLQFSTIILFLNYFIAIIIFMQSFHFDKKKLHVKKKLGRKCHSNWHLELLIFVLIWNNYFYRGYEVN